MKLTIKSGDTLSQIAQNNGTTVKDLLASNPQITNPNVIMAGSTIDIPGAGPTLGALPEKTLDLPSPDTGKTLPDTQTDSPLIRFSNVLKQITDVAKQKRAKYLNQFLNAGVPEGTRSASDFASLLKDFNAPAQDTTDTLVNDAKDAFTLKEKNASDSQTSLQDLATKAAEQGAPTTVISDIMAAGDYNAGLLKAAPYLAKKSVSTGAGDGPVKSGSTTISQDKINEARQKLLNGAELEGYPYNGMGGDGYADPSLYQKLYMDWLHSGADGADFLRIFPPKQYINPAANTLPTYLRNTTKVDSADSTGSEVDQMFGK